MNSRKDRNTLVVDWVVDQSGLQYQLAEAITSVSFVNLILLKIFWVLVEWEWKKIFRYTATRIFISTEFIITFIL